MEPPGKLIDIPSLKERDREKEKTAGAFPPLWGSGGPSLGVLGGGAAGAGAGGAAIRASRAKNLALAVLTAGATGAAITGAARHHRAATRGALDAAAPLSAGADLALPPPPAASDAALAMLSGANQGAILAAGEAMGLRDAPRPRERPRAARELHSAPRAAAPPPTVAPAALEAAYAALARPQEAPESADAPKLASLVEMKGVSAVSAGGIMNPFLGKAAGRRLKAPPRGNRSLNTTSARLQAPTPKPKSAKAMSQLKYVQKRSITAKNTKTLETKSLGATDAFEQGRVAAGKGRAPGPAGTLGETSALDQKTFTPKDSELPPPPPVDSGGNATPYQGHLEQAKLLSNMSIVLKVLGTMLVTIGTVLIVIGQILGPIGNPIKLLGIALLTQGTALLKQSAEMRAKAAGLGEEIQSKYGQEDQGEIVKRCAEQAGALVPVEACRPGVETEDLSGELAAVSSRNVDAKKIIDECKDDRDRLCKGVPAGGGRIIACLARNKARLDPGCREAGGSLWEAQGAYDDAMRKDVSLISTPAQTGPVDVDSLGTAGP